MRFDSLEAAHDAIKVRFPDAKIASESIKEQDFGETFYFWGSAAELEEGERIVHEQFEKFVFGEVPSDAPDDVKEMANKLYEDAHREVLRDARQERMVGRIVIAP